MWSESFQTFSLASKLRTCEVLLKSENVTSVGRQMGTIPTDSRRMTVRLKATIFRRGKTRYTQNSEEPTTKKTVAAIYTPRINVNTIVSKIPVTANVRSHLV